MSRRCCKQCEAVIRLRSGERSEVVFLLIKPIQNTQQKIKALQQNNKPINLCKKAKPTTPQKKTRQLGSISLLQKQRRQPKCQNQNHQNTQALNPHSPHSKTIPQFYHHPPSPLA